MSVAGWYSSITEYDGEVPHSYVFGPFADEDAARCIAEQRKRKDDGVHVWLLDPQPVSED